MLKHITADQSYISHTHGISLVCTLMVRNYVIIHWICLVNMNRHYPNHCQTTNLRLSEFKEFADGNLRKEKKKKKKNDGGKKKKKKTTDRMKEDM